MLIKDVVRVKDVDSSGKKGLMMLTPDAALIEAVEALADKRVGLIVICAENGSLAGVLSERDVIRAIKNSGHAALDSKVAVAMTKRVRTCRHMDPAFDVIEIMNRGGFRHMPVVENGEIEGLVSSKDIFRYMAETASSEEQAEFWGKNYWV